MASHQRDHWSNRRGLRAPNASPVLATPSQASPNRLGQWRKNYNHYKGLAEGAGSADVVMRESYWQYAEHFIRLINEAAALMQAAR
jgi:hypothetical protein